MCGVRGVGRMSVTLSTGSPSLDHPLHPVAPESHRFASKYSGSRPLK